MKKVSEVDTHHIMSNGVLFNPLAPEYDFSGRVVGRYEN